MSEHLSRREFLQTTAAVAGAPALSGRLAKAALTRQAASFSGASLLFLETGSAIKLAGAGRRC